MIQRIKHGKEVERTARSRKVYCANDFHSIQRIEPRLSYGQVMTKSLNSGINQAAEAIHHSEAVLITAGAGMGVDSGLPDFRGTHGFWKAYPPIAKLGLSFEEIANPHWFQANPQLAWAFYGHRLNLYRRTAPHQGFAQLLELAKKKPGGYFVFTSNVDGHFQKAGFDENRIEECHGSINHFQCVQPCSDNIWDAGKIEVTVDEEKFEAQERLPRCLHCGQLARPNVLMFGDWNWVEDRTAQQNARLQQWLNEQNQHNRKFVVIELGAGKAVATVRMTSERIAAQYNATLIRINPRDYEVPAGHLSLPFGAMEGIECLMNI